MNCFYVCEFCEEVIRDQDGVFVGPHLWHRECHYEALKTVLSSVFVEALEHDFPSDLLQVAANVLGVYIEEDS